MRARPIKPKPCLPSSPSISVQVLNEVTSVCNRKLGMPWSEIQDLLSALKASCNVVPLTVNTHAHAVQIAQQHQISFYDAHIVAAALASGASTLMTEDLHDGLVLGGLKIQNPFQ